MLFSVLLPTRDRLGLLRYAVESVRRQDDPDWEIVVSDNDSAEDVAGYVAGLADLRIRYVRTDGFVPVTDNWNNAIAHSSGEYLLMLGDDDALLPGYLSRMRALIERFSNPDAIYTGALLYAYPGVLPEVPEGYLQPNLHAPFFVGRDEPFMLARAEARALVQGAMDFRVLYDFGMQYVLISRRTIDWLAGDGEFYRSTYPDYYGMNLLFARAERIAVDPTPQVVIGITRSSFGFLHFTGRDADARAFLNSEQVEPEIQESLAGVVLPGSDLNTRWLYAMQSLHRHLGSPPDLRPSYARYRRLQAIHCERAYHLYGTINRDELRCAQAGLRPPERLAALLLAPALARVLGALAPGRRRSIGAVFDRVVGQHGRVRHPQREIGRYSDVLAVLDRYEQREGRAAVG
jgi:glycosyltransferase involved in cell wall biosynthesis